MRKYIVLFFALFMSYGAFSQNMEDWYSFEDEKTGLTGYKDSQGNVKIEPKFAFLTSAAVFKNIIPVMEEYFPENSKISKFEDYYLLKNGKKIGKDSLYVWDMSLDCEQEGKIRFRDPVTDKVGFFDKNGKVVIPAEYNDAKPFYNNLALAMKDAKRVCWGGEEYTTENRCEHWSWIGNTVLINAGNEVILDDLDFDGVSYLDWYSLKINKPDLDSIYVSFKSKNGSTYSFINTEKQFEQWFYQEFMPKNNSSQIEGELFETITFPKEEKWKTKKTEKYEPDYAWFQDSKKDFFSRNKRKIYQTLDRVNNKSLYETIIRNDFSPIMFDHEKYNSYFTDCGEYNVQKYPYFEVHITDRKSREYNHLGFIRTLDGQYKLLEITE